MPWVNALRRVRAGLAKGTAKVLAGPVAVWRGIRWAAGGAAGALRRGVFGLWSALRGGATGAGHGVKQGARGAWEKAGGARLVDRARSNPTVAVAVAAGVILACAWIGWAIYVTTENGVAAGLGVLITWPAVLLALAIAASPFVATALLIRRRRAGGEDPPLIAGGAELEARDDPDLAP